jgi:succinate dehydrogenase/fumarate reductase-like Fe-S protein
MNWYFSHLMGYKNESSCAVNIKSYSLTINTASTLLAQYLNGTGTKEAFVDACAGGVCGEAAMKMYNYVSNVD